MKAAIYRRTGTSDVLEVREVPLPDPGPGWVRVKLELSGVNPTDWKSRSGATGSSPEDFQIPHHDGAGTIDALGEGVTGLAVGQRVWVYLAAAGNRYGTAAEHTVVPAGRAMPLPDGAPAELGACLGVPALTAAHCLGGSPRALSGANVLVAGGAGAVGHYAIELAKHAGARVAATVSSERKAALARAAGADVVVDYKSPDAIEQVKSFGAIDRVVEVALAHNLELDLATVRTGATVVVYASEATSPVIPTRRLMSANLTVRWVLLYAVAPHELTAAVQWAQDALCAGALTALPTTVFPLDEVAAAQDAVEHGAVGKVLVALT